MIGLVFQTFYLQHNLNFVKVTPYLTSPVLNMTILLQHIGQLVIQVKVLCCAQFLFTKLLTVNLLENPLWVWVEVFKY